MKNFTFFNTLHFFIFLIFISTIGIAYTYNFRDEIIMYEVFSRISSGQIPHKEFFIGTGIGYPLIYFLIKPFSHYFSINFLIDLIYTFTALFIAIVTVNKNKLKKNYKSYIILFFACLIIFFLNRNFHFFEFGNAYPYNRLANVLIFPIIINFLHRASNNSLEEEINGINIFFILIFAAGLVKITNLLFIILILNNKNYKNILKFSFLTLIFYFFLFGNEIFTQIILSSILKSSNLYFSYYLIFFTILNFLPFLFNRSININLIKLPILLMINSLTSSDLSLPFLFYYLVFLGLKKNHLFMNYLSLVLFCFILIPRFYFKNFSKEFIVKDFLIDNLTFKYTNLKYVLDKPQFLIDDHNKISYYLEKNKKYCSLNLLGSYRVGLCPFNINEPIYYHYNTTYNNNIFIHRKKTYQPGFFIYKSNNSVGYSDAYTNNLFLSKLKCVSISDDEFYKCGI